MAEIHFTDRTLTPDLIILKCVLFGHLASKANRKKSDQTVVIDPNFLQYTDIIL